MRRADCTNATPYSFLHGKEKPSLSSRRKASVTSRVQTYKVDRRKVHLLPYSTHRTNPQRHVVPSCFPRVTMRRHLETCYSILSNRTLPQVIYGHHTVLSNFFTSVSFNGRCMPAAHGSNLTTSSLWRGNDWLHNFELSCFIRLRKIKLIRDSPSRASLRPSLLRRQIIFDTGISVKNDFLLDV